MVRVGPLLRPARTLRAARRPAGALRREPLRRRDRLRRSRARRAPEGGRHGCRRARARHLGSRREPGRARRGDARSVRLRRDAARAVDHGRAGGAAGPGLGRGRARDRRAAHARRLRGARGSGRRPGPLAATGRERAGDGRRPRVRRVALLQPQPRLGRAARHEERALQADRGAAAGALRRRGRSRRGRTWRRAPASGGAARPAAAGARDASPDAAQEPDAAARERLRRSGTSGSAPSADDAIRRTASCRRTAERGLAEPVRTGARDPEATAFLAVEPTRRSRAAIGRSRTSSRGATTRPSRTSACSRQGVAH